MPTKHKKRTKVPKYIKPSTEGRCRICHKLVKNLEAHTKAVHRGKVVKR